MNTWLKRGSLVIVLVGAIGVLSLYGVRQVEKFDAFCASCHMDDHRLKRQQSLAEHAQTLAASHHIKKGVHCIDCHGYDSFFGRIETTRLAASSLVHYVLGDYKEPIQVTEPIRDENCAKCHAAESRGRTSDDFHKRLEHIHLPIACVKCHKGHKQGDSDLSFLVRDYVIKQCRECHPDIGG